MVKPVDLDRLRTPSDPRLHPDGVRVAFTVSRPDLSEDRYERQIWLWDGHRAAPFTHGPGDSRPRWSPDGSQLLFLRAEGDDPAQLAVMPSAGGEARVLTDFDLGVSEAEWSPDGSRIAVVATCWSEELADLDEDERKRRPARVTRLPYRSDTAGWLHGRNRHIWLLDPGSDTDEPRCLTSDDDYRESTIAWRPDGEAIGFLSARHEDREQNPDNQAWEVSVDGDEIRPLVSLGYWNTLTYDSDGTPLVVGLASSMDWPGNHRLYRASDGEPVEIGPDLDRSVDPANPPFVTDRGLLTTIEDRGRVHLASLAADRTTRLLVSGDRCVTGVAPRPDGTAAAFTLTDPTEPGELWWWEDGEERRLTSLNDDWCADVPPIPAERFHFTRDGEELDGWLVLPPDTDHDPVPLLLNIHGGPTAQYTDAFFDEFQVYARAGYGVVAINPRGSSGRGDEFARAVVGTWDEHESVDVLDLRHAVDAALQHCDRLDPDRIGVMGGSYGGYATARIIAQDHRFQSAIVERGLLSWLSFRGTSDIGAYFDTMFLGPDVTEDLLRVAQASPVTHAQTTTTPTLVLHSENDWRCPIEQAEQYFSALRLAGIEAEMVRFPGEGHELSRSGKPKHRVERFEAILDWLDRTLS